MKTIKCFVAGVLLFNLFGCAKDGGIGPVGDAGNIGAQGPQGDKGTTGDKGATGAAGPSTASQGVSNVTLTAWKKATWKFESLSANDRIFEAEIPFSEITNEVINSGFVRVYSKLNNLTDPKGQDEFPFGVVITYTNSSLKVVQTLRGFKQGKVLITAIVESAQNNIDVIPILNSLPVEYRVNIFKK